MLSGGLDSSSILGAVASLGRARDVEALTASFPGLGCDETPYSAAVVAHTGVRGSVRPAASPSPTWLRAQAARYLDIPDYPNGAMFEPLKEHAASRGMGVLLFGCGGDEWFTGSVYRYGDWLRRGRIIRIASQIASDARVYGWRRSVYLASRVGIWPTAPLGLRTAVRRLARRSTRVPSWIDPDFAHRIDLAERTRWELPAGFATFAQADSFRTGTSGFNVHSDEMEDRSAARAGVEQRYPFYDRRLIEFALAIPEDQRCRGAWEKFVLRGAVRPWLPSTIVERLGKAEFSDPFVLAIRAFGGARAFESLRAARLGWVDGARLLAMCHEMERLHGAGNVGYRSLAAPLWTIIGIELWLEAVWPDETRRTLSHHAAVAPNSAVM
jgi:asparagine synthase (glutamine-hydrolysing)